MTASPRVSVVMGTFNRAHMIGQAIGSLQRQTFRDWELIIADDGSVDNTPATVATWATRETRIVSLRSDVNRGISRNYNSALHVARGEYVAMLDDDDLWCVDEKLEQQVAFLDTHPDHVGCGGGLIVIGTDGREIYRYLKPETHGEIRRTMLFANPMANSTTMFRRTAGEHVGWYDPTLHFSGDRDFWMKLALVGKLYNFKEYLALYTSWPQNTSAVYIKPHLRTSLMLTSRYRNEYPNYPAAIALNYAQYLYGCLPTGVQRTTRTSMMRLKRALA